MRSLTLDTTSFTPTLISLLRLLPNIVSNSIWERIPNPSYVKPGAQSSYEARLAYITAKYVNKVFVEQVPSTTSPNELLVKSITSGDIKGLLWSIARKADPNTRTPVLPVLVLAILQDEKTTGNNLSKTDSSSSSESLPQVPRFPLAELLLLNGAIPVDPRTLPPEANALSDAARRYMQDKLERIVQSAQSPPTQQSTPSKTSGLGISSGSSSSQSASIGGDLNRTVSKLQKRLSQGGKNHRTQTD
jgi:Arf-GAP/SH3 domain/ANK repeat/PH domain-containing protein